MTVLGVVTGIAGLSLGFRSRAGTEAASRQIDRRAISKQRLALGQGTGVLIVVTVMGFCFFAARTMDLRVDEQVHRLQIERYAAGDYTT